MEQTVIVDDQRAIHSAEIWKRDQSAEQTRMGRSLFAMLFISHARIDFSDAWTAVAIYFRNFLRNWRVNVPVLCFALLFLRFVAAVSVGLARSENYWLQMSIGLFGAACLIIARALTTVYRPSQGDRPPIDTLPNGQSQPSSKKIDPRAFLKNDVVWSILSSIALTIALCSRPGMAWVNDSGPYIALIILAIVGALLFAAGWIAGWPVRRSLKDFALWMTSGLVFGALVGLFACLFVLLRPYMELPYMELPNERPSDFTLSLPIIFGIPWVLTAQFAGEIIFSSYENDFERLVVVAIGWAVTAFLSIGVANLVMHGDDLWPDLGRNIALFGGMSGVAIALIGKSSPTSVTAGYDDRSPAGFILNLVLAVAGPVFIASLIVGISIVLDLLLIGDTLLHALNNVPPSPTIVSIVLLALIAGTVAALIGLIARKLSRPRLT